MTAPKPSCGTCIHAKFSLTPTGRVKKGLPGRCTLPPLVLPPLRACYCVPTLQKVSVWTDGGEGCPDWQAKP